MNQFRTCEVDGVPAIFHRWIDNWGIIPPQTAPGGRSGGFVRYTYGLVEYESGKIDEVTPSDIVFSDNLHKRG